MDILAPEIRIAEIFGGRIAKQARDVLADKGRREIIPRLEAVDHRRRGIEQTPQPRMGSSSPSCCSRVASAKTVSTMSATCPNPSQASAF